VTEQALAPGLYVVATPIGHLGDLTRRAIETLSGASFVVAEDTRRARQLLSHLGLGKPVSCIDAHASERDLTRAVERLRAGDSAALVTDAGMPCVSDPGAALINLCRSNGLPVTVVPGPSAVTTALCASGFGSAGFRFVGFLPRKGEKRSHVLHEIAECTDPVVLFESAQRLGETLSDIAELTPERSVCVARELTKQFEEVRILPAEQWARQSPTLRGEITVVLGPQRDEPAAPTEFEDLDALISRRLELGQSPKAITEALAHWLKLPRRAVYQRAVELSQRQ
jgi:16S rRNA (cytidine1402-2'-O)-methyltransferase